MQVRRFHSQRWGGQAVEAQKAKLLSGVGAPRGSVMGMVKWRVDAEVEDVLRVIVSINAHTECDLLKAARKQRGTGR